MRNEFKWLLGHEFKLQQRDLRDGVAFSDHKISFVTTRCRGKNVLDLGCVQHNPRAYQSRYWLHKAIRAVSSSVIGMDLYEPGVTYLRDKGFDVIVGDAQKFQLGCQFDVIVVGDLIEHLENLHGFFESCTSHLRTGGKLLISTPNPWYWRHIAKAAFFARVQDNPEHTLWLCPVTLRQLAARHGLTLVELVYGSRYITDRMLPLPRGIKHTSFHAALEVAA